MLIYKLRYYIGIVVSKLFTTFIICLYKRVNIGRGTIVYYKSSIVNLSKKGSINIGDGCLIGRSSIGYHAGMPFFTSILNDGVESIVKVGCNCRINGAYIHAKKCITLGNNCVVASGVSIIDSNGHETYSSNRTAGVDTPESVAIGDNVWIGLNSIVLKGTTIGNNSIVSAGSVVKGKFPENCLISGNPGNIVKYLNI